MCIKAAVQYTAGDDETRRTRHFCRSIRAPRFASIHHGLQGWAAVSERLLERSAGLLALVHARMRTRHLALRTEQAYLQWLQRYVGFHNIRDPRELGASEVEQFLTHLAVHRKVSAATQNQALQALLFLFRHVFEIELPWLDVTRAASNRRLPVVLSRVEVRALLAQLQGTPWLVASLLYGSGLRLMEAMRLRVKDLALERGELIVRAGKGGKDRVTMLPAALNNSLSAHLDRLREWFEEERRRARPGVSLPYALARKYPEAGTRWGWQYLFPASGLCLGSVPRSVHPSSRAPPVEREGHPACRTGSGAHGAAHPAGELSHAPALLCDAPAGRRLRHSHRAGAARALRPQDDDDLHTRHG
jgi:integron integrase